MFSVSFRLPVSSLLIFEQIIKLACAALLTLFLARLAGPSLLGQYQLILACCALLLPFASLGLNQIVLHQTAHLVGEQRIQVVRAAAIIRAGIGILFSLSAFGVFGFFYPWLVSPNFINSALVLFLVQSLSATQLYEIYLQHQGRFVQISLSKIVVYLLFFALKAFSLFYYSSLTLLLWLTSLELSVVAVLQYVLFRKFSHSLNATGPAAAAPWALVKPLLKRSGWLWLSGIMALVYLKIDVMMIESMMGSAAVGVYSAASRLSELWYVFPAAVATRYAPALLQQFLENRTDYWRMQRKLARHFLAAAVAVALVMTLLAPALVPWLFGDAFVDAVVILQLHTWAGCFIFVRYLVSQHLLLSKQEPLSLLSHGLGAVINVLLNWWLIPLMGLKGAAVATLVAYAFASFFFLFLSAKSRADLKVFFFGSATNDV